MGDNAIEVISTGGLPTEAYPQQAFHRKSFHRKVFHNKLGSETYPGGLVYRASGYPSRDRPVQALVILI